jgi:hypothetical protein
MVDSETSTSLSSVSRRTLLTGVATVPLAPILRDRSTDPAVDPVVALYREWRQADADVKLWCRIWGKLESALVRSVGFPRVTISLSSSTAATWVTTHENIDHTLADRPDLEAMRGSLHAELAAQTDRWNAEAIAIGFVEAGRREALALERREGLALRAFAIPAGELTDVLTKLTLVLQMGQTRDSDDAFPWPQIQSVINDLRRLITVMHP